MPGRVLRAACIAVVVLAVGAGSALASEGQALHAMKIDATGLTSTPFFFDATGGSRATSVETVELAAGTHFLQPGSGLVMALRAGGHGCRARGPTRASATASWPAAAATRCG